MEILAPTTVTTFLKELHIVDHSASTTYTLQVASFESIRSIKQKITLHAANKYAYLPQHLFIAIMLEDGSYTPVEFQYIDTFEHPNRFPDPLTNPPVDTRFVTPEGASIPINSESYKSLTFEQIPFQEEPVLHVWNLRSLAALADSTDNQFFLGFFQVYFPFITQPHQVEESLSKTPSRDATDTLTKLQDFQTLLQTTLRRMEKSIRDIESIHLISITHIHLKLPLLKSVQTEGLDIVFHTMKGSRFLPYIRYFPQSGTPILKLATGPSGIYYITNKDILGLFLMDIPDVEMGSVLMIKFPIEPQDVRIVQKGFAWTVLMYADGRAEVRLDAYRSDTPINYTLLEDAFRQLPAMLSAAGWDSTTIEHIDLSYFSGVYEINLDSVRDLNAKELQRRVKQYIPCLYEETMHHSKVNGIALRSRIGEFPPQEDPFQRAMNLYNLNKQIEVSQFKPQLQNEFGASLKEIYDITKEFEKINKDKIELYGEAKLTPSEELGATLIIENESPRFRFRFEYVRSMQELRELLTIAHMIILGDAAAPAAPAAPAPLTRTLSFDDDENTSAFNAFDEPEEAVLPPASKDKYDYVSYLTKADYNLFKFTAVESLKIGAYTTSCQRSAHRQPYVVSPNKYKDIKEKYDKRVHILEYPLSDYNSEVVKFVSSTSQERRKNKKSKKEKEAMEIHGLRLGIPLEGNESFLGDAAPARLKEMILEQQRQELWVILRAGSDPKKPNYYICSKLWCATDQIPILRSEYEGPLLRNGAKKKLIPSCPFCDEQNVIERTGDHIYAGYFSKIKHPKRYALPCCFKTPDNVDLPKDSVPIPDPPKGLEPFYPERELTTEESAKKVERLKDLGGAFRKVQSSSTYLLRSATSLTEGTIGIVPTAIDTLLGQSAESYTTIAKGNLKLETSPHAFIRFGIYGDAHMSGQNFLQFLSYLFFVSARIGYGIIGISANSMMCPTDTLRWLTKTHMVESARALEAANYGTLIREFYDPEEPDPGSVGSKYTTLEFQTWMGTMELGSADRAHVVRFFKAWNRFVAYLSDSTEPKELRLWDGFLSTPGLFSKDGIVLLRVVPEYRKEGGSIPQKGELLCSPFGISKRTQEGNPCMIPIYYMKEQGIIEPLIYVETATEYIGAIHPSILASYSKDSREKLKNLYYQFLEPIIGCGRPTPPIQPWFANTTNLVRLGPLLDYFNDKSAYNVHSILRERTNRVVGLLVEESKINYYIPVSDDGTISIHHRSSYDLAARPIPSYPHALKFFTTLSKDFALLTPSRIRYKEKDKKYYTHIELDKNILIPIEPFQVGIYPITLPTEKLKTILGEEEDTILLKHADKESMALMKQVEINNEELLEEAYQYLRLSFSNWLIRDGHKVATQIELLRAARNRLPLYELRKRGDLLLYGLIQSWVTTEGDHTVPPLLRQDCITLKEGECGGMCSWSDGRCKIHAPTYGAIEDPVLILTARLVDELLRTNGSAYEVLQKREKRVKRLRAPTGIVKEGDTFILSIEGRGDTDLYSRLGFTERHATAYTEGYKYPEEISAETLGREIATESGLPVSWEDAKWSRSGELFDIVRKLPQLQMALLQTLLMDSNITYAAFEKELKRLRLSHSTEPFTWSKEDLHHLSVILTVNIICTVKDERTGVLKVNSIIFNHDSTQYLLLDNESLPLLYKPSDSDPIHFVELEQLPEDVQMKFQ